MIRVSSLKLANGLVPIRSARGARNSWLTFAALFLLNFLVAPVSAQTPHLTNRIAMGSNFMLVVLPTGQIQSCGNNSNGARGLGGNTSFSTLQTLWYLGAPTL